MGWVRLRHCHDAQPLLLHHHHIRGVAVTIAAIHHGLHTALIVACPHCQLFFSSAAYTPGIYDAFTRNLLDFGKFIFSFSFVISYRTRPSRNSGGYMRFGTTRWNTATRKGRSLLLQRERTHEQRSCSSISSEYQYSNPVIKFRNRYSLLSRTGIFCHVGTNWYQAHPSFSMLSILKNHFSIARTPAQWQPACALWCIWWKLSSLVHDISPRPTPANVSFTMSHSFCVQGQCVPGQDGVRYTCRMCRQLRRHR